jgi:hypothetical protein
MRNDPPDLTIWSLSCPVKARYDATPRVRKARWVLSQLWTLVLPRLAQFPRPHLQVDSDAFTFLYEKEARATIFFEVLLADDLRDPVVVNLARTSSSRDLNTSLAGILPTRSSQRLTHVQRRQHRMSIRLSLSYQHCMGLMPRVGWGMQCHTIPCGGLDKKRCVQRIQLPWIPRLLVLASRTPAILMKV